jgi:hypothetical protein
MFNLFKEVLMKNKIIPLLLLVLILGGCSSLRRQVEIARQREPKFKVDLKTPKVPVGTVEAQLEGVFVGLKKVNINVTYSPVEDAVCLEFKRNTITNYQFFSRENRTVFLKALENYTEDFDGRNLVSNKKTKNQYGNTEGYLIWKATKISEQNHDSVDFSFGYLFKERSPFFTITQGEVIFENIFAKTSIEKYSTNGEFQLFFTRVQSTELAAYFDQKFLSGLTTIRPDTVDPKISYESY